MEVLLVHFLMLLVRLVLLGGLGTSDDGCNEGPPRRRATGDERTMVGGGVVATGCSEEGLDGDTLGATRGCRNDRLLCSDIRSSNKKAVQASEAVAIDGATQKAVASGCMPKRGLGEGSGRATSGCGQAGMVAFRSCWFWWDVDLFSFLGERVILCAQSVDGVGFFVTHRRYCT